MNHLEKYFESNNKNLMHKWTHYFEAYDRHFSKYRGQEIVVLEIGVSQGGSLQMWRDYFGPKAKIYGLDMEPNCITLANENTEILIGSQSDRTFLQDLKSKIPPIDILIDDSYKKRGLDGFVEVRSKDGIKIRLNLKESDVENILLNRDN